MRQTCSILHHVKVLKWFSEPDQNYAAPSKDRTHYTVVVDVARQASLWRRSVWVIFYKYKILSKYRLVNRAKILKSFVFILFIFLRESIKIFSKLCRFYLLLIFYNFLPFNYHYAFCIIIKQPSLSYHCFVSLCNKRK